MAKVLVSLDDELLARIDRQAATLGLSRSAFVAKLARDHVDGAGAAAPASARRALERARSACHAARKDRDATDLVRSMRDER